MSLKYLSAIVGVLVAFVLSAILRQNHVWHLDEIAGGLYFAGFWDLVFIGTAAFLAWKSASPDWGVFTRFILSGICGAVLGAILGIFFFPLSLQEQTQFSVITTVVGGLLAGVVGTQLLDVWKFLTTAPAGGGPPPIFQKHYSIAAGLFIAGLGLAAITEYAARYWVEAKVSITAVPRQDGFEKNSDGTYKTDPKTGALLVEAGKSVRFAGAASTPGNVAVHWRFEPAESKISLDPETGVFSSAKDGWPAGAIPPVKVIASGDADPRLTNFVLVQVDAAAAPTAPPDASKQK